MPYEIRIPRLGWSMEEGVFVGWLKQAGERVEVGQPLFELEGEKALQEIESVDAGTLHLLSDSPKPGTVVAVGSLLGYLLAPGESVPVVKKDAPLNTAAIVEEPEPSSTSAPAASPSIRRLARELGVNLQAVIGTGAAGKITQDDVSRMSRPSKSESSVATPRAKRIAAELGVDWKTLNGTGKGGRIRESDVRSANPVGSPQKQITISPRRAAIAERLRQSRAKTIPVTLTTTAEATNLVALREQFKAARSEIVPAFTDIVACLLATVLKRHPQIAVNWSADERSLISIPEDQFHIGVAVDTPHGLLVPLLRHVSKKTLLTIVRESKTLIERARAGRLSAAEMQGGVMTITNLGAYGIDAFTPIINYPEIAILGLGAIREELALAADNRVVTRQRITLSLTFDHAAIDGAPAAAFLRDMVSAIENPSALLLGGDV